MEKELKSRLSRCQQRSFEREKHTLRKGVWAAPETGGMVGLGGVVLDLEFKPVCVGVGGCKIFIRIGRGFLEYGDFQEVR